VWTIESWYREAKASAEAGAEHLRKMAEFILRNYVKGLPGKSREEIGAILAKSNDDRLAAVPDLKKYPELRGMRELVAARWRGVREGAKLDDVVAAVIADGQFYYHRYLCGGVKPKAQCSVAYFSTSDHGPLFAANLDSGIDEPYGPPDWPLASEHLVIGGVSSGVFLDEESPEIFPAPVIELVARYCRSTGEAVEMLTRYKHFWGPGNLLVIDRQHDIAMIEKTACRIGVRRTSGFGFITAMTAQHPEMRAFLEDRRAASLVDRGLPTPCPDTVYWELQQKRHDIMARLLDEARKAPTLEKLRALMQYRGKDGMVADNGDIIFPGGPPIEHTLRTHIVCLAEGRSLWWARDKKTGKPSWENRMPDVTFKDVMLWQ